MSTYRLLRERARSPFRFHIASKRGWISLALGASIAMISATPSTASETIRYTYDALGRLVQASHAGPINQGASATYKYDSADNRTNVTAITS
jgi:hypothetical protein